jgi:hypothetical protein
MSLDVSRPRSADARNQPDAAIVEAAMTSCLMSLTAWTALVVVGLAACSSTSDPPAPAAAVLAAEGVFEAAPVIAVDPSGTSATLSVSTDLEMACAVVFGRSEELGDGITTDADMGGGAHTSHAAVMTDLEPDTLYYYRVQGSGSDGRLYRSDLKTFRTAAAVPSHALGPNVALDALVTHTSSEYSPAFAAANAVDGNSSTEWSTRGDGNDASLTLDLGQATDVVGFGYRSRSMSDGTAVVNSYTVTVDGSVLGPFPAGAGLVVSAAAFRGQVLTFDAVTSSGGNTGATEIEVYSDPSG